ncbi:MAG: family 43 glycosylhydrolase [Lachnospiraceae bacterium]|nr:family 43 glycosylhydrolase [Robinsoniella sp.]MDY3767176.1 family 43 glycosylhydrolase [Lachnospiraceae bacterium]
MEQSSQIRKTAYNTPFILQRADPYVYRHTDGTYYFTASVPAYDRIILRCAGSIQDLQGAKERTVWTKHESGPQSKHIWAPEIHCLGGKWYIYYAAGEVEDVWKIRPYVLECQGPDPMEDDWIELGMMQAADDDEFSFQDFSLDATVFEHEGKYYYVWAEKVSVGRKISNLYIAEMERPWKLKTAQVLLTTPDYEWERHGFWVNEGPAILKHGDYIFLTYSASDTGAHYCMGMMWVHKDAEILDPRAWKKSRWPVVRTDEEKGIYGPGHNSFVKAEDGETDLCVYHARQYAEITGDPLYDPNRHAMLMKVEWKEDGMPKFDFQKQRS